MIELKQREGFLQPCNTNTKETPFPLRETMHSSFCKENPSC